MANVISRDSWTLPLVVLECTVLLVGFVMMLAVWLMN